MTIGAAFAKIWAVMRRPMLGALLRDGPLCIAVFLSLLAIGILGAFGITGWVCIFREGLGIPCPGCGVTRGTLALARGDAGEMWKQNPFTPVAIIALIGLAAGSAMPKNARRGFAEKICAIESKTGISGIIIAIWLIYGLARAVSAVYA